MNLKSAKRVRWVPSNIIRRHVFIQKTCKQLSPRKLCSASLDTDHLSYGCQNELFQHTARVAIIIVGTGLLTAVRYNPTFNSLMYRKGLNNLDVKVKGSMKFRNLKA